MRAVPRQQFAPVGTTLRALLRGALSQGPGAAVALQQELEARFEVPAAVAVHSGRAALGLLLGASEVPAGAGVALAALNFVPMADVIAWGGWRPVPVDVASETWTLCPDRLDRALDDDPGIRAVVTTHLFGIPCDMPRIVDVCGRHGVVLIEDCAHVVLQHAWGRLLGTFGAGALLSLEASKPLSALSGGVALCVEPGLAARVRAAVAAVPVGDGVPATVLRAIRFAALSMALEPRVYGTLVHPVRRLAAALPAGGGTGTVGSASEARRTREPLRRLGDAQAAIALAALRRLDEENRQRREVAAVYQSALPEGVEQPAFRGDDPALLYFPIAVASPERLASRLLARGVDTRRGYMGDCSAGRCGVAARLSSRMLCLPVWPGLGAVRAEWVTRQVAACMESG